MNNVVLITASGSIIAQGIIKSLKLANQQGDKSIKYKIIAIDMSAQAAGLYRCDKGILVPSPSSSHYINSIIKITKEENVQAIYVGSDQELPVISSDARNIEDQTKSKVLVNPLEVILTCRDKWKTYQFLKNNNLPCPISFLPEDLDELIHIINFPIIVKPREGYGSLHFYLVNDLEELNYAITQIRKVGWQPIIQEYLPGDEFTIGVTLDRDRKYIMSSISIKKISQKSGQTYKAFIDNFKSIRTLAEETALKLGACGAINIQAKLKDNKPKIIEINPRFSATTPMRAVAGINEPDIVFRNTVLGEEIKIDHYKRLISLRYWNEVYLTHDTFKKALKTSRIDKNDSFVLDYF